MAFEYNGVVYRDLEPQVRYDAEQVQLLKQADVTINENLQTMNTEIGGKLDKPTNPSAESAVTMLADGTVGTKPLSEIGGGKLYLHSLTILEGTYSLSAAIYTSTNTEITTIETLKKFISNDTYANIGSTTKTSPAIVVSFSVTQRDSLGILMIAGVAPTFFVPTRISDVVIEV